MRRIAGCVLTAACLLLALAPTGPVRAATNGPAEPAVWRPGMFYLRNTQSSGVADSTTVYGDPAQDEVPLLCDFSGSGVKTPVVVRGAQWFVRLEPGDGPSDLSFVFGEPGDKPLCGDWDGDGKDAPAVMRIHLTYNNAPDPYAAEFFLSRSLTDLTLRERPLWIPYLTYPDLVALDDSARPLAGYWENRPSECQGNPNFSPACWEFPGIYQGGVFALVSSVCYFEQENCGPRPVIFGDAGDAGVAGDWNDDGTTDVGVVRDGTWYLKMLTAPSPPDEQGSRGPQDGADIQFQFGDVGDVPLTH